MNRRALLKAAPAVALVGAVPIHALATQPDRMAVLVADWKEARDKWLAAVDAPGGGNFDSPECLRWEAEEDRITDAIKATPLTGPAGVAALIDFGRINHASQDGMWVDLPRWVLDKVESHARALIA